MFRYGNTRPAGRAAPPVAARSCPAAPSPMPEGTSYELAIPQADERSADRRCRSHYSRLALRQRCLRRGDDRRLAAHLVWHLRTRYTATGLLHPPAARSLRHHRVARSHGLDRLQWSCGLCRFATPKLEPANRLVVPPVGRGRIRAASVRTTGSSPQRSCLGPNTTWSAAQPLNAAKTGVGCERLGPIVRLPRFTRAFPAFLRPATFAFAASPAGWSICLI